MPLIHLDEHRVPLEGCPTSLGLRDIGAKVVWLILKNVEIDSGPESQAPGEVGMNAQDERVAEFHSLHASGCFVMPNPWDVGSAKALEQLGFPALATTSAGLAWTLGRADNHVTLDQSLEHLRLIAGGVQVPVNADFEGGFAVDPQQVHTNVKRAGTTGVAGLSIEDATGDPARPLHELDLAVERVASTTLVDCTSRCLK